MSELTKKETSDRIQAYITKNTKFMFYPNMNFKLCEYSRLTSKDHVELEMLKGNFSLRDAYVLQAVDAMGYATADMVDRWLRVEKRKYPDKKIPVFVRPKIKAEPEEFYDKIESNQSCTAKEALKSLASKGLLRASDYVTQGEVSSVIIVYTCNMYGHLLFRNMLDIYSQYDDSVIFRADVEVFRRLGATSIALFLANSVSCKEVYINNRFGVGQFKKIGYVYAAAQFTHKTKGEQLYIIEPVYFSVDTRIFTEQEVIEKIEERLERLRKCIEICNEEIPAKVIFCVENMQGLKKFLKLIKSRDLELFDNALYTSENVLYMNHGKLEQSFLKLKIKENGSLSMVPAVREEIFQN